MAVAEEVERWCAVTGGRGFAARHLVEMLVAGNFGVVIADLGPTIDLDSGEENGLLGRALRSGRAKYVTVDLRNKDQVLKAFEGVEVVFHMAAPNSSINNLQLNRSVNVDGTKNVSSRRRPSPAPTPRRRTRRRTSPGSTASRSRRRNSARAPRRRRVWRWRGPGRRPRRRGRTSQRTASRDRRRGRRRRRCSWRCAGRPTGPAPSSLELPRKGR